MEKHKPLWARKISKLQAEIGSLKVDGKNTFSKWEFISSNQLKSHLNSLLPSVGLICIPQVIDHEESIFKTKKGDENTRTIVTMSFEIMDTETGYSYKSEFRGADSDNSKSYAQATTDCFKRFWFNLLCIAEKKEDSDFKTTGQQKRSELKTTLNRMVTAFKTLKISKSDLEEKVKKSFASFDSNDVDKLKEYYEEVKDGSN